MITTLTGANSYMLHAALKQRTKTFVQQHGDLALETIDGEEATLEQIQAAVQSMPFLASHKLVILGSPSAQKAFIDAAETVLGGTPDTTDVLLVEPKLDKRTAYYKWLKKATDFQDYAELDARALTNWAVTYAKEQGAMLQNSDALYLVERVGTDQLRLSHELDKLCLHEHITKTLIDELTDKTPQSKIFDLLDAAFTGQAARALTLYQDQRDQRVEPQEIMALISWQLRQIALAKYAGTHDLVREGKLSPFSASKAQRMARALTTTEITRAAHNLVQLDARSKREAIDLDDALQDYVINLTFLQNKQN